MAAHESQLTALQVVRGDRRLTYISPYLKGPDDKPLRVTQKVFEVNR